MKKRVKKLFRGGIAVMLSLAMALSVFAGMELEVKAAGDWYFEELTSPVTYAELEAMCLNARDLPCSVIMQEDVADVPTGFSVICDMPGVGSGLLISYKGHISNLSSGVLDQSQYDSWIAHYPPSDDHKWYFAKWSGQPVSGGFVRITDAASIEKLETLYSPDAPYSLLFGDPMLDAYPADAVFVLLFWQGYGIYMQDGTWECPTMDALKTYLKQVLSEGKPIYIWVSDEPSASEKSTKGASEAHVHTHSYFWVTVQEASSQQDGIEEYRCSCGDVQERNIIPASEVLVKGFYGEIKNAPQSGTASFDTGRQYTLSDYIIRKLSERADVTTVITFEYEGQAYRMTIPAGADYTQLLTDEAYFYGYFYFANAVGAVIEAV